MGFVKHIGVLGPSHKSLFVMSGVLPLQKADVVHVHYDTEIITDSGGVGKIILTYRGKYRHHIV